MGGGWFNSVVRLRLSQPQAGDWAWAWAELGNKAQLRPAKLELGLGLSLTILQISEDSHGYPRVSAEVCVTGGRKVKS